MKLVLGLLALLVALGAGVLLAERGENEDSLLLAQLRSSVRAPEIPEPPEESATEAAPAEPATPTHYEIVSGGETTEIGAVPEAFAAEPIPMFRYFDGTGAIRMVEGLHNVPSQYRHSAREVRAEGAINRVSIPAPTRTSFRDWQPDPNPHRIVLYSSAGCSACGRARRHLDRLGVRYVLRDIHSDTGARDEVRKVMGRVVVPLLKAPGRYISGYLPREYDRLARRS